jgi:hypothetical protein
MDERITLQRKIELLLKAQRTINEALGSKELQLANSNINIPIDSLISFSDHISYSISPPPHWKYPIPLGQFLPPAPQIDHIKQSKLATLQKKIIIERMNNKDSEMLTHTSSRILESKEVPYENHNTTILAQSSNSLYTSSLDAKRSFEPTQAESKKKSRVISLDFVDEFSDSDA